LAAELGTTIPPKLDGIGAATLINKWRDERRKVSQRDDGRPSTRPPDDRPTPAGVDDAS
jgi:hypothetical protein